MDLWQKCSRSLLRPALRGDPGWQAQSLRQDHPVQRALGAEPPTRHTSSNRYRRPLGLELSSGERKLLVRRGRGGPRDCADQHDNAGDEEPKSQSRNAETNDEQRCDPENDSKPTDPTG